MWPLASTQTSKPHASVMTRRARRTSAMASARHLGLAGQSAGTRLTTDQRGRGRRTRCDDASDDPTPGGEQSEVTAPDRRHCPPLWPDRRTSPFTSPACTSRSSREALSKLPCDRAAVRAGRRPRQAARPTIARMTRDLHRPLREAWIVEAVRTPIGRYGGALAQVRPDDLAAARDRGRRRPLRHRPGADRGRHPRLREPGRRGQPRRRPDGAAAGRAAGRGRWADRQPPVRVRAPGGQLGRPRDRRRRRRRRSSAAASSR